MGIEHILEPDTFVYSCEYSSIGLSKPLMPVFCYLSGAPRAGAWIEFIEKVSAYEMTALEKREKINRSNTPD